MSIKSLICRIEELEKKIKGIINGNGGDDNPTPPVDDNCCIDDTATSTDSTWSSDKIDSILDYYMSQFGIDATYIQPELVLTGDEGVREVGSTSPLSYTATFTQNDAGPITSQDITENTVVVSISNTYTSNVVIPNGTLTYEAHVSYADGPIKNDSLGNPDPSGKILAGTITSNQLVIEGIYPVFYGSEVSVPDANTLNLTQLTKDVVKSDGDVVCPINCTREYLIIAIPASSPDKTKWYVDGANQGDIGVLGTDLFNPMVTVTKSHVNWNNVPYDIYISDYPTTVDTIILKNS